ncbi:MAG TPA: ATP synthase subunit I [Sulfuricella sp.]|nr:ATP synthase subunit I [Sulfuricella sp.]
MQMDAAHRVVGTQAIIAIFSAALLYYLLGKDAAKAAFFGGVVATANGLIFLRKIRQAEKAAITAPISAMSLVYSGIVTRFILVLMLFGLGFGALHLQPVPALFVFALAQLAYGWGLRKSYKDIL